MRTGGRRWPGRRSLGAWGTTLLVLAACAGDDPAPAPTAAAVTTPPTTMDVPSGGFYEVPDPLPQGDPGDVVYAEPFDGLELPPGAQAWRVLYHSRSVDDEDVPVSGVVIRPPGPAPTDGFPVVAWAHGTTGAADECAPSRSEPFFVPALSELLATGHVVAATDYEGLGTPGVHPYLVGASEGRAVLDSVRAAGRLEGVDASGRVVIWGHSQGGHAALFAGELAPDHAPELEIAGVVAGAPAADVATIMPAAARIPAAFGFAFLTFATWSETFPDAELGAIFAPDVTAQAGLVDEVCLGELFPPFAGRPADQLTVANPNDVEPWDRLLVENSAGRVPTDAPVLIVHGDQDDTVPIVLSDVLVPKLCQLGTTVEYRRYPGASHVSAVFDSAADVVAWARGRLAGEPAPSSCE